MYLHSIPAPTLTPLQKIWAQRVEVVPKSSSFHLFSIQNMQEHTSRLDRL